MNKIADAIRRSDLFAIPVQLTYKGSKAFNTMVGGCFSIALILAFMSIFAVDIHRGITNPEYVTSVTTSFARFS